MCGLLRLEDDSTLKHMQEEQKEGMGRVIKKGKGC